MSLTRSLKAKFAKYIFYTNLNTIDIFIEDTDENTRKIMLELLQRGFSDQIKISQIFSLGGRDNVINKYLNRNQSRTQIFIVDGDLYLLYSQETFQKGLVIFDKYCIENYLFDTSSILKILYEECSTETDYDTMCTSFGLTEWWEKQKKLLYRLFIEYGIEKKNALGIMTIKYNVNRLMSSHALDRSLVAQRIRDVRSEIKLQIDNSTYNTDRIAIINNIKTNQMKCEDFVSAKDYILPLVFSKLKNYSKSNLSDNRLKYRLSTVCNISDFTRAITPHL